VREERGNNFEKNFKKETLRENFEKIDFKSKLKAENITKLELKIEQFLSKKE